MKGFERCFKVEDKIKVLGAGRISKLQFCDRPRREAKRIQIKLYEPHLGKEKPVMGNTEPLLGITYPAEGLNKPCNVKIPFIS